MTKRPQKKTFEMPDLVRDLLDPVCRKRGLPTPDLITHWNEIVGAQLADVTRPQKLNWPSSPHEYGGHAPATLFLECEAYTAIFIQHQVGELVERINQYFGYRAIDKIKLVQSSELVKKAKKEPEQKGALTKQQEQLLASRLKALPDGKLKSALNSLGRSIAVQQK